MKLSQTARWLVFLLGLALCVFGYAVSKEWLSFPEILRWAFIPGAALIYLGFRNPESKDKEVGYGDGVDSTPGFGSKKEGPMGGNEFSGGDGGGGDGGSG